MSVAPRTSLKQAELRQVQYYTSGSKRVKHATETLHSGSLDVRASLGSVLESGNEGEAELKSVSLLSPALPSCSVPGSTAAAG